MNNTTSNVSKQELAKLSYISDVNEDWEQDIIDKYALEGDEDGYEEDDETDTLAYTILIGVWLLVLAAGITIMYHLIIN